MEIKTLKVIPTSYTMPFKYYAATDKNYPMNNALRDSSNMDQSLSGCLETDNDNYDFDIAFHGFDFSVLPEDGEIGNVYINFTVSTYVPATASHKLMIYSGDTKLYEFNMNLPSESLKAIKYTYQLADFKKEYLNDFKLVYQYARTPRYGTASYIYGMDVNISYGISPIKTVVTTGYSKQPDVVKRGEDVQINNDPATPGYVGNLYNDNLDDYAEFHYIPNTHHEITEPEKLKELTSLKIDSPSFTLMGVPNNATITGIKMTKFSKRLCGETIPDCDLYLDVAGGKYDIHKFVPVSDFTEHLYDTGEIEVHKLKLKDDKVSFILQCNSYDTPYNLQVKYLLWDITYKVNNTAYAIHFFQDEIQQISIGNAAATAVYVGVTKIYG